MTKLQLFFFFFCTTWCPSKSQILHSKKFILGSRSHLTTHYTELEVNILLLTLILIDFQIETSLYFPYSIRHQIIVRLNRAKSSKTGIVRVVIPVSVSCNNVYQEKFQYWKSVERNMEVLSRAATIPRDKNALPGRCLFSINCFLFLFLLFLLILVVTLYLFVLAFFKE